ncbi:MAG: type II secretion system GspH family protein [Gammaproteobacteria bacterium]|nr:type II secretion system GspH family protein [Gammaproteobacteria bacterium]
MMRILNKYKKAKGVTLLETLLAVALITLGLALSAGLYQKMLVKRKVAQIQQSVILLGAALQQYYNVNCYYFLTQYALYAIDANTNPAIIPQPTSTSDPQSPVLSTYISTPQLIGNAYGSTAKEGAAAYTYNIDVQGDTPILSVSTQFLSAVTPGFLSTLQGILKPDIVDKTKKQFTWYTSATNRNILSQSTELSPNRTYLETLTRSQAVNETNRQLAMQYMTPYNSGSVGSQFANVCTYWQVPANRCQITKDPSRCSYQPIP